ncbi:hypothetical protein [Terriglobus sp.]|uniref:hypothetical protein n=1 Tax=Terriglobus sp. TaxID=1889013 RepID=UPI003AFFD78D
MHTRMPVILHVNDYDRWLSREATEHLPVDLLGPFEAETMRAELTGIRRRTCSWSRIAGEILRKD